MASKKFNGTLQRVYLGSAANSVKLLADEMSCDFTSTTTTIDTSSKDDNGDETFENVSKSRSISFSAQVHLGAAGSETTRFTYGDIMAADEANTLLHFKFATAVVGDINFTGRCRIISQKITAQHKNVATVEGELKVYGAVTTATNA